MEFLFQKLKHEREIMKKAIVVLSVLLLSLTLAFAAPNAPQVISPVNGDRIGPNIDIKGMTEGKQFVVVITDVIMISTNELVGSVPGIRHWTEADGTFAFRVATPRVRGAWDNNLVYRVRVFTARPDEKSSETVITCKSE